MHPRDIAPRKSPRQNRSLATVGAILDAAARVLATESLQGFNTNRVAEVAGVSVGSLYQYFPNKAGLMLALIEQAQSELASALEAAVKVSDGQPLEASLRVLVRVAIEQQYGQPLLAAALDHEERRLPVQRAVGHAERRILFSIEALLERHLAVLSSTLPSAAARDCLVITKSLVEADSASAKRPPPDLEDRIVRALLGYLTVGHGR
jgi:AcrR family transcriptional regulator